MEGRVRGVKEGANWTEEEGQLLLVDGGDGKVGAKHDFSMEFEDSGKVDGEMPSHASGEGKYLSQL